jgi:hypothetical protein
MIYMDPAKAVIVKSGEISKLIVLHDNKPVTRDITAVQITIWNRGNLSIRRDNVLEPIRIKTKDAPILEATIRKKTREVTGFAVDSNERDKGQVSLSWTILEPGDGAVVQLIFAGNAQTEVLASGIVEGVPRMDLGKHVLLEGKVLGLSDRKIIMIAGPILLVIGVINGFLPRLWRWERIFNIAVIAFGIISIILVLLNPWTPVPLSLLSP